MQFCYSTRVEDCTGGGGATDHGANISAGYQPSENHSTIAYAVNEIMVVIEILSYVLIYIQQFC